MENKYIITLIISVSVLIASILSYLIYNSISKKKHRKKKEIIRFFIFFAVGVFLSAVIIFVPLYYLDEFSDDATSVTKFVKTFLLSIHNATRLFILDGDFVIVQDAIKILNQDGAHRVANLYGIYTAFIYVLAPVLTFSFIFAVIANFRSKIKFHHAIRHGKRKVFIFSELNRKSILLAESIHKEEKYKNARIFFADVDEDDDEMDDDLIDRAKEINAIMFKKEISSFNYGNKVVLPKANVVKEDSDPNEEFDPIKHIPEKESRRISLFFMKQDDTDNVREYYDTFKQLKKRGDVCLYLFSTSASSELAINHVSKDDDVYVMRRRVTIDNFFIYRYLFEEGYEIFKSADDKGVNKTVKGQKLKVISAVIIGLGRYGRQFLQALSWYGQMYGYYLKINAFDADPNAEQKIAALSPDLLNEKYNKKIIKGDAQYDITIHSGVDLNTKEFKNRLLKIKDATICYTCLGKDEDNVDAAILVRSTFASIKHYPLINAVVQELHDEIADKAINHAGQEYKIDFIGNDRDSYSVSSIIDSELEEAGKRAHVMWSGSADDVLKDIEKFYRYEYFYLSSCASALHTKAKKLCNFPGINKKQEDITKEEYYYLTMYEHMRWNAWMRSQGFRYSGARDKKSRNDLAKLHNDLVDYVMLSQKDIDKDGKVISLI